MSDGGLRHDTKVANTRSCLNLRTGNGVRRGMCDAGWPEAYAGRQYCFRPYARGTTALTDDRQHGYFPLAYDSRNSDYSSDKMLPGSAHDFIVIFSMPKDANLKDFIKIIAGDTRALAGCT